MLCIVLMWLCCEVLIDSYDPLTHTVGVASLAMGQSYDLPIAGEMILTCEDPLVRITSTDTKSQQNMIKSEPCIVFGCNIEKRSHASSMFWLYNLVVLSHLCMYRWLCLIISPSKNIYGLVFISHFLHINDCFQLFHQVWHTGLAGPEVVIKRYLFISL